MDASGLERAAKALREIELSALAHHEHEGKMTLLHALQVEIPKMAEDARAAIAAHAQAAPQGDAVAWRIADRNGHTWVASHARTHLDRECAGLNSEKGSAHYFAKGPYYVAPCYAHPPAAELGGEAVDKAVSAAHRQEASARKAAAAAEKIVADLPCYLGHTTGQVHLCAACRARVAIAHLQWRPACDERSEA